MINPRIVQKFFNRTYVAGFRLNRLACLKKDSIRNDDCCFDNLKNKEFSNKEISNLSRLGYNNFEYLPSRNIATSSWNFVKSKDRGKDKKKPTKVQVNINELSQIINVEKLLSQMENAVDELKDSYSKNLTLRSSIGSIEQLPVNWEGKEYVLQELAQIARKPKMLVINVSAFPQIIPSVIEAIGKSGMNLNPQQDGTTLFVPIPKVTKEHREGLAKNAKALFVGCRDSIRDVQNRCFKSLKNKSDISADTIRSTQSQVQALADKYIEEADGIFKMKQKELLGDSD